MLAAVRPALGPGTFLQEGVTLKVYKIEGAKNTFALVSFLNTNLNNKLSFDLNNEIKLAQLAAEVCKHPELQADGCVFVKPDSNLDFAWDFFNSDGSDALMCGNAARAVSLWYNIFVNSKKVIQFTTPSQNVRAEILSVSGLNNLDTNEMPAEGQVKVCLKKTEFIAEDSGFSIYNSGVPHLCVLLDSKDYVDKAFADIGREFYNKAKSLRFPKALDTKGSNVTFIWSNLLSTAKKPLVNAMSFERGVENWTQACGTGAMAAAYVVKDKWNYQFPINVQMPGGVLEISESKDNGSETTTLTGPALVSKVVNFKES